MKQEPQPILLDVSWEALIKVLVFVVGIWMVVSLKEIIILLFGVFIFVAAVNPTISRWQTRMSRLLAVSLFYTLMLVTLAVISSVVVPNFVGQLNDILRSLPTFTEKAKPFLDSIPGGSGLVEQGVNSLKNNASSLSGDLVQKTFTVFGSLATIATGLVLSFYLLLEENNAKDFFHQVLPQHRFDAVYKTVSKISSRMGSWVRGQILLMAIIAVANLVIYFVLRVPSPLPLAVWSGLCEVIPFVGPLLGVIPALIVVFITGSTLQAVLVVLLGFFVIQQLEAHFIVPRVMSRAVGLSPVLVIIALTIGAKLLGLVGAIIAVPVAAIISVIAGEWSSLRKIWEDAE